MNEEKLVFVDFIDEYEKYLFTQAGGDRYTYPLFFKNDNWYILSGLGTDDEKKYYLVSRAYDSCFKLREIEIRKIKIKKLLWKN